jgi:hypothetical protein
MKHILLLLTFLFISAVSFSQDFIYFLHGKKITAMVLQISKDKLRYHAIDDPEGVIRDSPIRDIFMIQYRNGKEEIFGLNLHGQREKFFSNGKDQYYSLAFGGGVNYGFFGFRFQHRWGKIQGWAYHAAVGLSPYGTPEHPATIDFSVGMKYFFYKGWYLDLGFGSIPVKDLTPSVKDTSLHSADLNLQDISVRTAYGIICTIGGDWFFNRYVGVNADMGAAFNLTRPGYSPVMFAINIGFFFKILDKRKK